MVSRELLRSIPQFNRVIRRMAVARLDGATTIHHLRILFLVSEGQCTSQMAETLCVSAPAISKTVNALVLRNLITRSIASQDKRSVKLALTSKGKKTLSAVGKDLEKNINKAMAELTPKEVHDLDQGLTALDKLMKLLRED